jgi:hypothetical protein
LPSEATRAELDVTRRSVDDLPRHARLITAIADNSRRRIVTSGPISDTWTDLSRRSREVLRQLGLDPIDGRADEVARAIAASRIRDAVLGELLGWHSGATFQAEGFRKESGRSDLLADATVVVDRLAPVIRSVRQLSGGAYARWQDLLDRDDVPGLLAFAASPDGLRFRPSLVLAVSRDLIKAQQFSACQSYLRAGVDRYPQDPMVHVVLAHVCRSVKPPDFAEALRHSSAASALQPDSVVFLVVLSMYYAELGAYDQAIAASRKAISLNPTWPASCRSRSAKSC